MKEINLINVIIMLAGNLMIIFASFYCWHKLLKFNIKKKNLILILLLATLLITIIDFILTNPFKIIIGFIAMLLINYAFITRNIKKSIILVTFSEAILGLAEFSFAIVISLFYKGNIPGFAQGNIIIYLILNIYVSIICCFISNSKKSKNFFQLLNNYLNEVKNKKSILYLIMIIIVLIISTAESYINLSSTIILITNAIIAMTFIIIVLNSTKTNDKYYKINSKYETSINSLKEYEAMIDRFRVSNHENKNQLLTVRNMIKDNPDKAIEYIDTLVNHKFKDNEAIMYRTSKIPEGGLRATIYSKLCIMDKEKIKYTLDIANDVRTAELINIDDDLTLDICKILGVFLDNAIEAVKSLRKRQIDIEMYIMDGKLCIDITNNFKGNFDLEKIGSKKYSTKGANHRYGLSLVSQIIKEHSNVLENEKSINKNTFTQCLKIKM